MIDRKQWPRVKFGDVVRQVKDRVDADYSGLNRYIAGEHMDTDDLRLRRWGEITGDYLGPAFQMRFRPGQVLYGSRRTYLRKVAVADFEGICANTTFVLETKDPTVLLPELLPFIMQTEIFHDHSIKQSKGSVNPYINFSDLEWFEFALPPMEEQRRITDLLWSVESQKEALLGLQAQTWVLRHALEKQVLMVEHSGNSVFLGQMIQQKIVSLQTGPFGTVLKASAYTDSGHPVINPSDMVDGEIRLDKCRFINNADWERLKSYHLEANDIFIGRKGDMQNIVFINSEYNSYLMGSDTIRFRVHDAALEARFLYCCLRADVTREWLQAQAYGTIMPGINEKLLARMMIPLPDLDAQLSTIAQIETIDRSENAVKQRLSESHRLKLSLLADLL